MKKLIFLSVILISIAIAATISAEEVRLTTIVPNQANLNLIKYNSGTHVLFLSNGSATGGNNTAVGHDALLNNTTGSNNSAFGYQALLANTDKGSLSAFGSQSLMANTTGMFNSAFGLFSLGSNTSGGSNSAFGCGTMGGNTSGGNNCGFGYQSLVANSTGSNNSAYGQSSLYGATGSNNSAFGDSALANTTTGDSNTACGRRAGNANTTGIRNTYLGYDTGNVSSTGNYNTFIGYGANTTKSTLSNGVAIGYNSCVKTDNTIVLGGTGTTKVILGEGSLTTPTNLFCKLAGISTGTMVICNGSTGQIGYDNGTSSKRYKHDIRSYTADVDKISELNPVRFTWNADTGSPNKEDFGLIAEDVYKIYPELVGLNKDGGAESVDYAKISVILIKCVQKQKQEIDSLKARLDEIEKKIK